MIRVDFFGQVRETVGGRRTEVPDCPSVGALLSHLAGRYGKEFLPSGLIIMVNGRHIAHTGFLETPLEPGDLVSIFPVIGGG
jgi:molybdopterin converting factor small subunit